MPKQFVRPFGHNVDSTFDDEILILYTVGQFPQPETQEEVIAKLANLFFEHYIDKPPVIVGRRWSGISGELLISPANNQDWISICNFDFDSSNDVVRVNAGLLAWSGTAGLLGSESSLGFRLRDQGYGYLPANSYIKIWGSAVEYSSDLTQLNDSPTLPGGGNGGQALTASQIVTMLQSLTGSDRLDASAIEGLGASGQTEPALPLQAVQFNNNGSFAGNSRLTFDPANIPIAGTYLAPSGIVYSQSSFSAISTSAQLNDGLVGNSVGIATALGAGSWIKADLGAIKTIDGVQLGGGVIGAVNVQSHSPNWVIQVSSNDEDWEQMAPVGVVDNAGVDSLRLITFPQVQARYVRILNPSNNNVGAGATEFRVRGNSNPPGGLLRLLSSGLWVGHTDDPPLNPDLGVITASVAVNSNGEFRLNGQAVIRSDGFYANGQRVVTTRQTGWTAGAGTALLGSYNTGTATLAQVAQRVLALEQAMRTHGLIN